MSHRLGQHKTIESVVGQPILLNHSVNFDTKNACIFFVETSFFLSVGNKKLFQNM